MKIKWLCFLVLMIAGCREKDCSSIDLSALNDIKLSPKVVTQAKTLQDFMSELNFQVHRTHRLIMRCKSEQEFEDDKVLPGVMLWISDSWELRSDSSSLGKLFYQHGIDPWERTRVAGILFHRFLNKKELDADHLLADAEVKSTYHGRVQTVAELKQLSEPEKNILLKKIHQSDSALSAMNITVLSMLNADPGESELDKIIAGRYAGVRSLNQLMKDVANEKPGGKKYSLSAEIAAMPSASGFQEMTLAEKLILIETLRMEIIGNEKNAVGASLPVHAKAKKATKPATK